jgi:hypothetical protein
MNKSCGSHVLASIFMNLIQSHDPSMEEQDVQLEPLVIDVAIVDNCSKGFHGTFCLDFVLKYFLQFFVYFVSSLNFCMISFVEC